MDTTLDIVAAFPAFSPYSAGSYEEKSRLTINTINQVFPALRALVQAQGLLPAIVTDIGAIASSSEDRQSAERLKLHLDRHGSDKATFHDYHYLYGHILKHSDAITGICEIGLGTNNPDVVSNMGEAGQPGASLRAFRDHCQNASIYGADVDRRILFEDDRIRTYFVDQTNPTSLDSLGESVPGGLDLVIDDGLHSPDANLHTLRFGLTKVKVGGWVVVEDVSPYAAPLWECVSAILAETFESYIFNAKGGVVFATKRVG